MIFTLINKKQTIKNRLHQRWKHFGLIVILVVSSLFLFILIIDIDTVGTNSRYFSTPALFLLLLGELNVVINKLNNFQNNHIIPRIGKDNRFVHTFDSFQKKYRSHGVRFHIIANTLGTVLGLVHGIIRLTGEAIVVYIGIILTIVLVSNCIIGMIMSKKGRIIKKSLSRRKLRRIHKVLTLLMLLILFFHIQFLKRA